MWLFKSLVKMAIAFRLTAEEKRTLRLRLRKRLVKFIFQIIFYFIRNGIKIIIIILI